jgi:hypothetical protein
LAPKIILIFVLKLPGRFGSAWSGSAAAVRVIAVFKIVGTAAIPLLFWAVVAAKLQTIVSHSFLHRFLRFFK